jgi:flagellar basal-body rod modification protein FlgD
MTTNTVNSTSNYYQSLLDATNTGNTTTKASTASEAQDRFLKLLTTQLRNQDPLNPLDNAQMTSQMAQISTVTGIEKLNATLQALIGDSQEAQSAQAASLVGHSVMVPGNTLMLSSSAAVGGIELASAADDVKVTIKDSNGIAVRTVSLGKQDAGIQNFVWDGKTDSGAQAADGNYTVSVAAKQGDKAVTATTLSLGLVRSIIRGSNGLLVDVGSLGSVVLDDVRQIL